MFGKTALQRMTMSSRMSSMMSAGLVPVSQRSFAVDEKAVKARMKSVKSLKQITNAMKMVSTAKMKGEIRRLRAG